MSNPWRFLRAAWFFARNFPYVREPYWGESDASNLKTFLNTPTGKRFWDRRVAVGHEQDQLSTMEETAAKGQYAAGIAVGYRMALAEIISDSESKNFTANGAPPKEGSSTPPDQIPGTEFYGVNRLRETLTP